MARPITALIVDDEQHVHVYLRILLKQLGIATVWDAADGHSALELAEEHKPDVVLLDMNLPQLSGMEVLERLKKTHPKMHVVVVSVESKPETLVQARELGADGYVLKHYPRDRVLKMLSDIFNEIAGSSAGGETPGGGKPADPA